MNVLKANTSLFWQQLARYRVTMQRSSTGSDSSVERDVVVVVSQSSHVVKRVVS